MPSIERWQTARDWRVCHICRPLEGHLYVSGEGPRPPLHPKCRCHRVPVAAEDLPDQVLISIGINTRTALEDQLAKTNPPNLQVAVANAIQAAQADATRKLEIAIMLALAAAAAVALAAEEVERRRREGK